MDLATRPDPEPLWLPSGWLAVVVVLAASVPAWGASGWRARSADRSTGMHATQMAAAFSAPRRDSLFRTVDFQSDIAGPAQRVAQFDSDPLREAIERPFGAADGPRADGPSEAESIPTPTDEEDLYSDLPPDPFDEPMDSSNGEDESYGAADPQETGRSPYESTYPSEPSYPESTYDPEPSYEPTPEHDALDDTHLSEERTKSAEDCAEGLAKLKANTLDRIDLEIGISGVEGEDFPFVCSVHDGSLYAPRQWADVTFMWKASALCHKPLYFEDVHLERHGHSWGPIAQPIVSGAHFFSRFAVLPYCMGLKTPTECVYTLGHYRPGNCAPYMIDPIPFTWRAALFETGGVFGMIGIFP